MHTCVPDTGTPKRLVKGKWGKKWCPKRQIASQMTDGKKHLELRRATGR